MLLFCFVFWMRGVLDIILECIDHDNHKLFHGYNLKWKIEWKLIQIQGIRTDNWGCFDLIYTGFWEIFFMSPDD